MLVVPVQNKHNLHGDPSPGSDKEANAEIQGKREWEQQNYARERIIRKLGEFGEQEEKKIMSTRWEHATNSSSSKNGA